MKRARVRVQMKTIVERAEDGKDENRKRMQREEMHSEIG